MARKWKTRLAAQAAAVSMRNPIPNISDDDEIMEDAPAPTNDVPQGEEDEEDGDEGDRADTPALESDPPSRSATPRRSGRQSSLLPRKRRLGRPPKNRPPVSDDEGGGVPSDTATPRRRGGFRGHRGGRWAKKYGPSHVTQVPIDREGNTLDVVNDEVELPDDTEGETKIDKNGGLQGGREYRVRTFTIIGRGKRLYMLSTEPARCIGFRDSYLFFQRHKMLYKIILDDEEKLDLISRDHMPHSYKGRAIGVVTARSVFREFGAKIIIGGRKVVDDYDSQGSRDRGDVEGELAVPEDRLPAPGEPYNRNQYVAWHGASAVYHTNLPNVPMQNGKIIDGKRKKITVTSDNWMLEHAREASRFNQALTAVRKNNFDGVYDVQTNTIQYSKVTQPTHARWEIIKDEESIPQNGKTANGVSHEERTAELPELSSVYSRNFRIHDLCLEGAPQSQLGLPGLDRNNTSIWNVPRTVLDELPPKCLRSLEDARESEVDWRSRWLTENLDGKRTQFLPTSSWFS